MIGYTAVLLIPVLFNAYSRLSHKMTRFFTGHMTKDKDSKWKPSNRSAIGSGAHTAHV